MKIQYEKGDKVIITNCRGLFDNHNVGDVARVIQVDATAFASDDEPYYQIEYEDGKVEWVYDYNINPATVSLLCKWDEVELNKYAESSIENDVKKCLEFLASHPGDYYSVEEIRKEAKIEFTSLDTLRKKLNKQNLIPNWVVDGEYKVIRLLKPNKKVFYGDDGSVVVRGKSEELFNAIKIDVYGRDHYDEEESEEDE